MNSSTFTNVVAGFFDKWLSAVHTRLKSGEILISGPYSYPTNLRVGESPSHHIAELLGSAGDEDFASRPRLVRPTVREKVENTSSFFNPGFGTGDSQRATLTMSVGNTVSRLCCCTRYDRQVFMRKVDLPVSDVVLEYPDADVPLSIPPSADYSLLRDLELIRTDSFRVLFRTVSTAVVVKKKTAESEVRDWLDREAKTLLSLPQPDLLGLNIGFPPSPETFARELSSLADQQVTEPVIDAFLASHADYFARALGYTNALSQRPLQWIERESDDPKISKPDYLMERKDGYWDILDLKRAALRCQSITIGGRSRLRFNAYVAEMIAQLKGYERYFSNHENAAWALANHGVKVRNPRLVGIVGNYDSFIRDDVDLALEQYKDNIVVLSYQDVIDLLRKRNSQALT